MVPLIHVLRKCSLLLHIPGCFCNLWQPVATRERFFLLELLCLVYLHCHPRGFQWLSPSSQRPTGKTQAATGKQGIEESNWVLPKGMAIFCDFQYKTAKYSNSADIALIMNNLYHSRGLWYCSFKMFCFHCILIWTEIGVVWIQWRRLTVAVVSL